MASQSLIDELTASCADVDLGRRATILSRLTNLLTQAGPPTTSSKLRCSTTC